MMTFSKQSPPPQWSTIHMIICGHMTQIIKIFPIHNGFITGFIGSTKMQDYSTDLAVTEWSIILYSVF